MLILSIIDVQHALHLSFLKNFMSDHKGPRKLYDLSQPRFRSLYQSITSYLRNHKGVLEEALFNYYWRVMQLPGVPVVWLRNKFRLCEVCCFHHFLGLELPIKHTPIWKIFVNHTFTSSSMILSNPLAIAISSGVASALFRIVLSAFACINAVIAVHAYSALALSPTEARICSAVSPSSFFASSISLRSTSANLWVYVAITSIALWKKLTRTSVFKSIEAAVCNGVSLFTLSGNGNSCASNETIFVNFGFSSLTVNLDLDLYNQCIDLCNAFSPSPITVTQGSKPLFTIHSRALTLPREAAQCISGYLFEMTGSGISSSLFQPIDSYFSTQFFSISRFERWPNWSVQLTMACNNSWCSGHSTDFSQNGVHLLHTTRESAVAIDTIYKEKKFERI